MVKRQWSRVLLFWFLLAIPFVTMIVVNTISPAPTREKNSELCTRYCHDHPCPHTLEKHGDIAMSGWKGKLYTANINWLKKNPFGLSYTEVNILIYVLALPFLMATLLWGVIRKRKERARG